MITYLLDHGLNIDYKNKDGNSLLHLAAEYEGSSIFKQLIDKGIAIDALNDDEVTALFTAAENEDFEAVKSLISLGANLHYTTDEGESFVNSYDLSKENLWNDLMSFNLSRSQLNFLLIKSVFDLESLEKVKQLVTKGADVTIKDEDGVSLIEMAEQIESPEIIAFLKSKGAK